MKRTLLVLLSLLFHYTLIAQTFNGSGGSIPDDGTSIRFPVTVSGLPTSLDTNFGIVNVCIYAVHPYDSDLDIWLIAPDSTYIELSTGNGGSGDNYWNTCFYDSVPLFISSGTAPFTGSYRPESPLYNVNNGQNPNATWQLLIHDTYPFADAGLLVSWTITFGNNPPQGLVLQSSNLPIIKINTSGQSIPDDPKIMAHMQIIDNGPGIRNNVSDTPNVYDGYIGIEVRGSSSQMFPKKSFGLETWDSTGNSIDTSLFGLPSESDWILNANYTDKTFMRNVLSYDRSRAMGHYASGTRYCEVILNSQYQGIYVFMEKIKRDPGRVNIAKLTPNDTTGDDLTGGYILKVDKTTGGTSSGSWLSLFTPPSGGPKPTIQIEYPVASAILPVQVQYIEQYSDSFENALHGNQFMDPLNGYRKYIDVNSWVDYFLLSELSKNVDGYRISTYFYKEKDSDGGLLHMGPVWDYDIAWGNADYYDGNLPTGYSYQFNNTGDGFQVPFWWSRLLQDPFFRNTMRCRWEDLRDTVLSTAVLHSWIDSIGTLLNESQDRNFTMWPILGTYVWPNPSPIPPDYPGVIQELKDWITNRALWMDANLPGNCSLTGQQNIAGITNVNAYPNPAVNDVWLLLPEEFHANAVIRIENSLGQEIHRENIILQGHRTLLDVSSFRDGILFIELQCGDKIFRTKVLKNQTANPR